jgi:hypothetical protein
LREPACKRARVRGVGLFARGGESVVIPHPFRSASEPRIERNPRLSKRLGCWHSASSGPNCRRPRNGEFEAGRRRRARIAAQRHELNAAPVVARLSCPLSCCQTAPVPRAEALCPHKRGFGVMNLQVTPGIVVTDGPFRTGSVDGTGTAVLGSTVCSLPCGHSPCWLSSPAPPS